MPPAASRREQVLEALQTRAAAILTAGGFNTDLGAQLLINEIPALGPDDARQALVLLVGDDEITAQGGGHYVLYDLPVTFLVLVDADLVDGWRVVEQGIADVKRALETADATLGGLAAGRFTRRPVETIPREVGSAAIGAAVPYVIPMKEGWGAP